MLLDRAMGESSYLRLGVAELRRRAAEALEGLRSCKVCPWDCGIDRLADQRHICRTGRYARVASFFPHFGEENCLRGWKGSGTIFFAWCNLRCVFCQNYDISQEEVGVEARSERLAEMMLDLQRQGCHNINFVTPEHVVPQILEALPYAVEGGLRLPLVYNTSAYDSLESLRHMDGVIDIYMPDFKFWDPVHAKRYTKGRNYPDAARTAIQEMYRQVGDLVFDENGLARRGLLVRHLVMPGGLAGTRDVMRFLARDISPNTYVNIMAQYYPAGQVSAEKYAEINRQATSEEHAEAIRVAREEGLTRFDERRPGQRRWLFL
jgi:putative pyruvate formate lyase activating enzyme